MQSYSWFASRELIVSSFVDFWGMDGRELPRDHSQVADRFGGVPAPRFNDRHLRSKAPRRAPCISASRAQYEQENKDYARA